MSSLMVTAHGRDFYLHGPYMGGNGYAIEEIAHSLAQINRFTGHANRPYSVAEHSMLCADIAERMEQPPAVVMAALMHDAHESRTGDCSSPAKAAVGPGWNLFEDRHAVDLRRHFGLTATFYGARKVIGQCDDIALATERRDLVTYDPDQNQPWPRIDRLGAEVKPADWVDLNQPRRVNASWLEWREQFLERYHAIKAAQAAWWAEHVRAQA